MEIDRLIRSLSRFPSTLRASVDDLTETGARWKPPSSAWPIVAIVMHLADEGIEDFRRRIEMPL